MDAIKALHEWKKGGRGETMMSTFEYKSSHDKMFIEGFRMAELYYNEPTRELKNRQCSDENWGHHQQKLPQHESESSQYGTAHLGRRENAAVVCLLPRQA